MKYKHIDNSKINCFLYTFLSIFLLNGKKECKELLLQHVFANLKKKTKKNPFTILQTILLKLNILCKIKQLKVGNSNYKIAISIKKKYKRKISCKTLLFNIKHLYIGYNFYNKIVKEIVLSIDSSSKTLKYIENMYISIESNKTIFYSKL